MMLRVCTPLLIASSALLANSSGPDPGSTGVPGEGTCNQSSCHVGNPLNAPGGSVAVEFPTGFAYSPGVKQRWIVRVSDPVARGFGFQVTVRSAANLKVSVGRLDPADRSTFVMCSSADFSRFSERTASCPPNQLLESLQHSQPMNAPNNTWVFDWTPPSVNQGEIRVYVAGNAVNLNGQNSGDRVSTANYTLNPCVTGCSTPSLNANPLTLSFSYRFGQPNPPSQTIAVNWTGAGTVSASATATWITLGATSFVAPSVLTVICQPAGLLPGTYRGNVTLLAGTSTVNIAVTLVVTQDNRLSVSPPGIDRTVESGSPPFVEQISLTATGTSPIAFGVRAEPQVPWLALSASATVTPAVLTLRISPDSLPPVLQRVSIIITPVNPSDGPSTTVSLVLTINRPPPPSVSTVRSAASGLPGPIAPGQIVSIYGSNLGPRNGRALELDRSGNVTRLNGGVRALFDNNPAPLLFVRQDQVNAIVPYDMHGRASARLIVEVDSVPSAPLDLRVEPTAPAIFTIDPAQPGRGQAAVLNQDGSVNGGAQPASAGSVAVVFLTGEGILNPVPDPGAIALGNLPRPLAGVTLLLDDVQLPAESVLYAGPAPSLVFGVMQVNFRIPANARPASDVPLSVRVGTAFSQPSVTMAIR